MTRIYVPSMDNVRDRIKDSHTKKIGGKVYHFYTAYHPDSEDLAYAMAARIRRSGYSAKVVFSAGKKRLYEVYVRRK